MLETRERWKGVGEAIAAANRFAVLRRDRANLADRLTRFLIGCASLVAFRVLR